MLDIAVPGDRENTGENLKIQKYTNRSRIWTEKSQDSANSIIGTWEMRKGF